MHHLPPMIVDLAVILVAAALSTLIFSWLRQPVVLGYLIAGFCVGPHFSFFPTVTDTHEIKLWAEIGVIFLLFGLGLEFSFKKLAKVGKSAAISAIFEIATMGGIGYLLGRTLGWNAMNSIYLGAALSVSSTTIIVRAFNEAGLKGKSFVNLVFGILIVEDLIAILLLVLLAAISSTGTVSGSNLAMVSARLGFFLLIWFLVGIYLVPTLLKKVRTHLSNEIMLIVSISLCFLMVVLADKAGFSAALGAFIMGSILAETEEGERIEHLLSSVKDLFAAVFFVSVGMMIDPNVLQNHFAIILLITAVTILGKLFGTSLGAILSGRSLRQSLQSGMSLAQIGEFSFIIISLGASLKVIDESLYPIVISVSAVTTFTTPYLIKFSGPFAAWTERKLPQRMIESLAQYERAMSTTANEGALRLLWRTYGVSALLNTVVILGIGLAAAQFGLPILLEFFGDTALVRFFACVGTMVVVSPFLLALALKPPKRVTTEEVPTLLRLRRLQFGMVIMRLVVGLVLIEVIVNQFATTYVLPLFILIAGPLLIFIFRPVIYRFYDMVETRFLRNLNAKELAELERLAHVPQLTPWNASLTQTVLSPDSSLAGHTLEESKFRSKTGASIVMIDRGRRRIFAPSRSERLLPFDELFLIGNEDQLSAALQMIEPAPMDGPLPNDRMFNLDSLRIDENSRYARLLSRDIGIGEDLGGLIVGIERGGQRILNPESVEVLEPGDLIWIFGHRDRIREMKKSAENQT